MAIIQPVGTVPNSHAVDTTADATAVPARPARRALIGWGGGDTKALYAAAAPAAALALVGAGLSWLHSSLPTYAKVAICPTFSPCHSSTSASSAANYTFENALTGIQTSYNTTIRSINATAVALSEQCRQVAVTCLAGNVQVREEHRAAAHALSKIAVRNTIVCAGAAFCLLALVAGGLARSRAQRDNAQGCPQAPGDVEMATVSQA